LVEAADVSDPVQGLQGLVAFVNESGWGAGSATVVDTDVILVTDGGLSYPASFTSDLGSVLPFGFPGSFHVVVIDHAHRVNRVRPQFTAMLDKSGVRGEIVTIPELNRISAEAAFQNLAEKLYKPFVGTLTFGQEMSASVGLSPPPAPYHDVRDFETVDVSVSDKLHIKGILSLAEVASPPVISRHLVLPVDSDSEIVSPEEVTSRQQQPTLPVFLHNGLSAEGMCALVQVTEGPPTNWFGILFCCAEKKKSSLMLALFEPGDTPVPWLGNLRRLGPASELSAAATSHFPVRASAMKPSYSSSPVVWIENQSLLHDIQRILRHARKLPEKIASFYKELNRLKRAALCLGFYELLDGVATIFEHESVTMPQALHPDCSRQLRHAAYELRSKAAFDVEYNIAPPRH